MIVPAREQARIAHSGAATDRFGIDQRLGDAVAVLREKLGVALGDVPLALFGQLDRTTEEGTGKSFHEAPFTSYPTERRPRRNRRRTAVVSIAGIAAQTWTWGIQSCT